MAIWLEPIVLLAFLLGCEADVCYYGYSKDRDFYYCEYGCCGYYNDRYCCNNISMVVGAVVGGIIALSCVVAIIICICICHNKSDASRRGVVVVPSPNTAATTGYHVHRSIPPPTQSEYGTTYNQPYPEPYTLPNTGTAYPPPGPAVYPPPPAYTRTNDPAYPPKM